MSVATRTSYCPLLNLNITSSRSACSRSLCMAPQFTPICWRETASCFTLNLLPLKTMTRFRSPALKMSLRMVIFWVS